MLDEKDRRALADIESRLRADDPEFARRMSAAGAHRFPALAFLCVTTFLALPFVALFLGPRVALVVADVVAVTVVVVMAVRHRSRRARA